MRPIALGAAWRMQSASRLVFDCHNGRTRLLVSDLGAPLRVMRGFTLEDGRLLVQIISAAPGLFSGDRYKLAVEVRAGARAVVLTPAATKIHSMPDGGSAEQVIRAEIADGGSLEIYPTLSIPFVDSDFEQRVDVALNGKSRFGWLDPWSFGRISSGECYAFRRVATQLRIDRDGRPLYRDALELEPAAGAIDGGGLLEHATHSISGCWFGPCTPWPAGGLLHEPVSWGVVAPDGLYARGLFSNGAAFRQALDTIHSRGAEAWGSAPISQSRFTL